MVVRIGELNQLITIQQPAPTKTDGVTTTSWITFKANVWASIKTMRAYERANANAVWPGADVKIVIRYLTGITGNMRIVDDAGVIYAILGQPNDVDRKHQWLELTCQSGVKTS
jgi:SPP1 family predicted phage head-tail adaptor